MGAGSTDDAVGKKPCLEAWRRQIWEATLWRKVNGPAGAVFCEFQDLGIALPSWHMPRVTDGRKITGARTVVRKRCLSMHKKII